jgi:hypothetical protein
MNELIYNIKMTLWFVMIMSFVLFRYFKLEQESMYHGNDFEWLTSNFIISTGSINYTQTGVIYIIQNTKSDISFWCLQDVPTECLNDNKFSLKCLAKIKEKWYWYYNWYYFKPADFNCR